MGHQIVGDYAYSNRTDVKPYRMMLHAHRLVIPMLTEHIDVVAPDPFKPEIDKLWKPEKVVRTYDDYVKDMHFRKAIPQQPKKKRLRDKGETVSNCNQKSDSVVAVTGPEGISEHSEVCASSSGKS